MTTQKVCDYCKKVCDSILIGLYINKKLKDKPLDETGYIEGQPYYDYNDFDFCSKECFTEFVNKNIDNLL